MTPRQFLRQFTRDARLANGRYFSVDPLEVSPGDRVGVVLMNLGGPRDRSEVDSYLYRRWMDPAVENTRVRFGRHLMARLAAALESRSLWRDYEQVGGVCPGNQRSRELADALSGRLNGVVGSQMGITFKSYLAMRYGTPSIEDTLRAIAADEVTKTILLPLSPQYSVATTGTSLAYWSLVAESQNISTTGTSAVLEYAAHPDYLQSLSERIDEALQRFPKRIRPATDIVFCAKRHVRGNALNSEDSFCTLMHESVTRLNELRGMAHQHHVTFFSSTDSDHSVGHEDTRATLQRLAGDGVKAVLLVPIGCTTDDLWTCYTLDIALRQEFQPGAMQYFEVASALNCHPLFITALTRVVAAYLRPATDRDTALHHSLASVQSFVWREPAPDTGVRAAHSCSSCEGPISPRLWPPAPTTCRPAAGA